MRHLPEQCSGAEREELAISAQEILSVLAEGKGLDLIGVVVKGDITLDILPSLSKEKAAQSYPALREADRIPGLDKVRLVKGPISILDSRLTGLLGRNVNKEFLVLAGHLLMSGTTFEGPVDFTRSIFLDVVDFSQAVLQGESYFVLSQFHDIANFEKINFGVRTRFHKAQFFEPATFFQTRFNGLSEFLEVRFKKTVNFSYTHFRQGTGFSGAIFGSRSDFSKSRFEGDVFFLYSIFEQDVSFAGAQFDAKSDFSHAQFKAPDNLSQAIFKKAPELGQTQRSKGSSGIGQTFPMDMVYGIVGAGVIFLLLFFFVLRKRPA